MAADDEPIGELAQAVLDGDSIDWAAAESNSHAPSGLIRQLKIVATVAQAHREDQTGGPEDRLPVGAWGHLRLVERIGRGALP